MAEQILPRGYSDIYEKEYRRKDGTVFPVEVRTFLLREPGGQSAGMWAIVRDISERKRAADALREARDTLEARVNERTAELQAANTALTENEERYRTLAESSPDAIFILDQNNQVQYANSTAAAFFGRAPADLIGRKQAELLPTEIAQHHAELVRTVFATGNAVRRDEQFTLPVGAEWIEIRLAPLFADSGTVSAVMGIYRDITERKRAERQLAEALELNQKMIAASTMGIAAFKASGECVFVNDALAAIIGGSLNEMLHDNFRRRPVWRSAGLLQLAEEALIQGRARSGEFQLTMRSGKTLWLDCHMDPFVSNHQPHLLVMVLDISERKRAQILLEAQRDVGVSLSHTSDMSVALQGILEIAVPIGGLDCGGVYLLDPLTLGLDLAAHRGLSESFVQAVRHYSTDSPQTQIVMQGRPVFTTHQCLAGDQADETLRREGLRAIAVLPLSHNQRVIGALNMASHTADEVPLQSRIAVEAIAAQAAGAVARISAEAQRHRLERQILEISDREHARIGQDIHDGLCQHLVSLAFDANSLQRELRARRRPEAKTARRIERFLDQAITESRQLARGLFPVRLETDGLPPALEELAKATSDRFKIRCRFKSQGLLAAGNIVAATHLYRIAQEAVSNAIKHGRARSISIRLCTHEGDLELIVEDNGAGYNAITREKTTGLGLHIMNYRARTIGGVLNIRPRPQGGTLVSCCIPLPAVKESSS